MASRANRAKMVRWRGVTSDTIGVANGAMVKIYDREIGCTDVASRASAGKVVRWRGMAGDAILTGKIAVVE